jgi:crotonobetainyl-CoA:carnitine CoA-transferase CaiB-like acyl-CoA transferase
MGGLLEGIRVIDCSSLLAGPTAVMLLGYHGAEGQEILRRLASRSDVLIENFRPGRLEQWGLVGRSFMR